jgi:hypothetical protein
MNVSWGGCWGNIGGGEVDCDGHLVGVGSRYSKDDVR